MKLSLVLLVCALAAAAASPTKVEKVDIFNLDAIVKSIQDRGQITNSIIREVLKMMQHIVNEGWERFDIPALDPLIIDDYHLVIPAGLINLDLQLRKIQMTGLGGVIANKSWLDLDDLTFDLDFTVPMLDIRAEEYDLVGDIYTAIPLYGKGQARFVVEDFRFTAKLFLKRSSDRKSVIIDRIENTSFIIPSMKSELTGAIGGGDIDAIVNSMIDEVIIDYVNRFQGAISSITALIFQTVANPILEQFDTWKYIIMLRILDS